VGFEPTVPLRARLISSQVPSTNSATLPSVGAEEDSEKMENGNSEEAGSQKSGVGSALHYGLMGRFIAAFQSRAFVEAFRPSPYDVCADVHFDDIHPDSLLHIEVIVASS
jgi:hypothetical protein